MAHQSPPNRRSVRRLPPAPPTPPADAYSIWSAGCLVAVVEHHDVEVPTSDPATPADV